VGPVEIWVEERSWEKIEKLLQKSTNGNDKGENEEKRMEELLGEK
jgi:hypothetical protein